MTPSAILLAVRDAAPDHVAVAYAVRRLARLHAQDARSYERDEALVALGRVIARVGAAAEFVARATLYLDRVGPKPATFAASPGQTAAEFVRQIMGGLVADSPVPGVLPASALKELYRRAPTLARTAAEVRAIYTERAAFACARAADVAIARRTKLALLDSIVAGHGEARAAAAIASMNDWTLSYAQTCVRTNATTAYAAGRMREAKALKREGVILGALRFDAMLDSRTRPNHAAADGLIADVDDSVWDRLSPPLSWNCRCVLSPLDELDVPARLIRSDGSLRRATTPVGAFADTGFGRRPDAASFPLQV